MQHLRCSMSTCMAYVFSLAPGRRVPAMSSTTSAKQWEQLSLEAGRSVNAKVTCVFKGGG